MSSPSAEPAKSPPLRASSSARLTEADLLLAGISPSAYALLSLIALLASRGVAPALPGSATGITELITGSAFVAACLSQLLAAGGVVLCIRLLGLVSALPSLGVAFRMVMLPTGLAVVALAAAASARPLEPDLGRVLSIAASVAIACVSPHLLALRWSRLPGFALLSLACAGALTLVADELWSHALNSLKSSLAIASALGATALGVASALLALRWSARNVRQFAIVSGATTAAVVAVLGAATLGKDHTAGIALVLLHRSLEALSQAKLLPVPLLLAEAATLLALFSAAAVLLGPRTRKAEHRAGVALCLLGSVVPGAPASALLTVAGALLLSRATSDPHAERERSTENPLNRLSSAE